MKSKVFTVYDSKIEAYMSPFLAQTKGAAIRMFSDTVNEDNNSRNQIAAHPEDFTLFEIGEYDDQSGVYTMLEAKVSLGIAKEFKKQLELPMAQGRPLQALE